LDSDLDGPSSAKTDARAAPYDRIAGNCGRSLAAHQLEVSAISGPSALPPNFLQSGHASSSINGQPYSGAKGEPLREVAQI
jgi:hypothetical protein